MNYAGGNRSTLQDPAWRQGDRCLAEIIGYLATEKLVEHDAQRIDITADIDAYQPVVKVCLTALV